MDFFERNAQGIEAESYIYEEAKNRIRRVFGEDAPPEDHFKVDHYVGQRLRAIEGYEDDPTLRVVPEALANARLVMFTEAYQQIVNTDDWPLTMHWTAEREAKMRAWIEGQTGLSLKTGEPIDS
jgi:hypothetical protein